MKRLLGSLLLLGCTGGGVAPPAAPRLPEATEEVRKPACDAGAELTEARARYARGEWFASFQRFQRASERCPGVETHHEQAAVEKLLAEPGTFERWIDAARTARLAGKDADARLAEDRAAYALQREAGAKLAASAPLASHDSGYSHWVKSSRQLLTRTFEGFTLRERDAWFPRFFRADPQPAGWVYQEALASDEATLLSVELPEMVDAVRQPVLRLFDVRPSAAFGSELARFSVNPHAAVAIAGSDQVVFVETPSDQRSDSWLTVYSLKARGVQFRVQSDEPGVSLEHFVLSPDGRHAMLQWRTRLGYVDLQTGKTRDIPGPGPSVPVGKEAFSPDGHFVVWRDYDTPEHSHLAIYDTETGSIRRERPFGCRPEQGFTFDDASTTVALGSPQAELCLLTLATGKARRVALPGSAGTTPLEFLAGGRALWVHGDPFRALLELPSGRILKRFERALGLLHVDGKPTFISADGSFTVLEPSLALRTVEPNPVPAPASRSVSGATRLGRELALRFADHWLIADTTTGRTRPLELPVRADTVKSPDDAFLATDAATSELFSVQTGKRAARSPVALAGVDLAAVGPGWLKLRGRDFDFEWRAGRGGARLLRPPLDPAAPTGPCFDATLTESSLALGLAVRPFDDGGSEIHSLDCASGAHGPAVKVRGAPVMLASPTRVIGYGVEGPDAVTSAHVWDLASGRPVATVAVGGGNMSENGALSSDDRYLVTGGAVWDVASSRKLVDLGYLRDKPGFLSPTLLAVREPGRIALHRAPGFARAGVILAAADLSAVVVLATDASGIVTALEVLGDEQAFDTTLSCGVGVSGVPFRICREAFARKGLLEELAR